MNWLKKIYTKYREVISYLFFGVLTTLINFVVYFICYSLLHFPLLLANTLAWFFSVMFAFFTNRKYVFNSKRATIGGFLAEMGSFFVARLLSLIIDNSIMQLGVKVLHQNDFLVKIIDQFIIVLINYIFSKWIFHPKKE